MKNYKELIDKFNQINQDQNVLKNMAQEAVEILNSFCKQKMKKNSIVIANYLIKDYLLQKKPINKTIFKNVINFATEIDDPFFQAAIKEIAKHESLWFIFKTLEIQLFYESIEQQIEQTKKDEPKIEA